MRDYDDELADIDDDADLLDDELDTDDDEASDDFDDGEGEEDDYEDATADEIDFVVALYREDGQPNVVPMAFALANDLDDLITMLRRFPGDAGATGVVSINGEFFMMARVRGRDVRVLLSDAVAANFWPIARDVADFLGADIPGEDDASEPLGDLGLFADVGLREFDMETIIGDYEEDSDEMVRRVIKRLGYAAPFAAAVENKA
ncbi:MAG: tRNA adenosine deaminase-associated protein [Propionibacteriaceae bacterium]|jgi:putative tRNA adenosine deaminase-associated protein|nr:tRNA adenosine deaminase-associated protein [Propionibacteriaceae bacterium]